MGSQKKLNKKTHDAKPGCLGKNGVLVIFILVFALIFTILFCLPGGSEYFLVAAVLLLSISWVFNWEPAKFPRFKYSMVAGSFFVLGGSTLCSSIDGIVKWHATGSLDKIGVPWPIILLAAVAELIPLFLWVASCRWHAWVDRGIDEWISKMSIYSILWDVMLFLSIVDTTPQVSTADSVEDFMWTCLTSFLIIGSLKESLNAIVTFSITDNNLV